jgi:hypothetical protein
MDACTTRRTVAQRQLSSGPPLITRSTCGPASRLNSVRVPATDNGAVRLFLAVAVTIVIIGTAGCRRPSPTAQHSQSAAGQSNPYDRIISEMTRSKVDNLIELENKERRAIGVFSPQQLYDEYTRNQFAAEANFDGQFVKVVGPLVGIRRDDLNAGVLRLGLGPTYASGASIEARFNPEDEGPLKGLTVGQVVAVIGSPQYDATDGLLLLRCMIAPPEDGPKSAQSRKPSNP